MPAVSACWSQDYSGTDGYHAIGLLRKTSKLFANSEEPGICQRAFSMASTNVSRSAIAVMRKLLRPQWSLGSRNKKTKRAIDGRALFEVYLWRFLMETLRNRRNVPESSSKTSSLAGPQAHSRVSRFSGSESSDCESVRRIDGLPALFAWDNLDLSARDRRISGVLG